MIQAIWNGTVIAESEATVIVEGSHYFPSESICRAYFEDSETQTVCGWKGVARYYSVTVDGRTNPDAAWYYPDPKPQAEQIRGSVAFWNGVEVRGTTDQNITEVEADGAC